MAMPESPVQWVLPAVPVYSRLHREWRTLLRKHAADHLVLRSLYILDYCNFTDLKREPMRSRILELAKERDLIVPTCSGAYAPARMVLRPDEERSHGGS